MSRFLFLITILFAYGVSSPNAEASNCSNDNYEHNGSGVEVLICSTGAIEIAYVTPRSGLRPHGVKSGTLLFDGARQNGVIQGQARIFSNQCGETPYAVAGAIVGNSIVLRGNAPRLNANCRVTGTRPDRLVFNLQQAPTNQVPVIKVSSTSGLPQFRDYPARIYNRRPSAPDLSSHPEARTYRTRLRNAAKGQVNFAGEYIVASWGCGTSCLMGAVINARTGRVHFLPHTVCCGDDPQNGAPMDFRADSNLIIFSGLLDENDPNANHYFEFAGGRFQLIQRQEIAANNSPSNPPANPTPQGIRTDYSATRVPSTGGGTDVTDFTLINDFDFDITINWLDGGAVDRPSDGGEQTPAHPMISRGDSWRVENGARTADTHWFSIVTAKGFMCSFSPRQGEIVRVSELPPCARAKPDHAQQVVQPTCPKGFDLSGGRCVRNAAPSPSCPAGFKFSGGQCVSENAANPPSGQTLQQCAANCDSQIGTQCDRELTRLGDAQGWDGDLRQDYWNDTCVPKVNACKFSCNPNRPIGPGECRFEKDGSQLCS